MTTLFYIPYITLSRDTVGTLDSLFLDMSAVSTELQRLLIVIPDETPGEVLDECIAVCKTASDRIGIEFALSGENPRMQLAQLSRIRQIVRVFIPDDGYYQPVERGERNHVLDALPSFFAYGYEIGIMSTKNNPKTILPLLGHVHTVLCMGAKKDVSTTIRAVHDVYPTTAVTACVTSKDMTDARLFPLVQGGLSVLYVPLSVVSFEWDTCTLHTDLTSPVSLVPFST